MAWPHSLDRNGVDTWVERTLRNADQYEKLGRRLEQLTVTGQSPRGITVTIDHQGCLTALTIDEECGRVGLKRLADEIMTCLRHTQAKLADRVAELAREALPADDTPAAQLVSEYRTRFPAPSPAPAPRRTDDPPHAFLRTVSGGSRRDRTNARPDA